MAATVGKGLLGKMKTSDVDKPVPFKPNIVGIAEKVSTQCEHLQQWHRENTVLSSLRRNALSLTKSEALEDGAPPICRTPFTSGLSKCRFERRVAVRLSHL